MTSPAGQLTRYAAFLRGINVGTGNRVAMPQLRTMAEELGYADVTTYINSGNLVFSATADPAKLSSDLRRAISTTFGLSIDVAVRSQDQLRRILAGNPYPAGELGQVTVALLTGPPAADAADRLAAVATEHEPYTVAGEEIWVNYSHGLAGSKLAVQFSRIIGVSATVRNVRTLGKVAELLDRQP